MSWGSELWDKFEDVSSHTLKGIDFCERFSHFIKERSAIELDYAAKLKKLVKSYQPKKKSDEDEFTFAQGFQGLLKELIDYAGQHEFIAEELTKSVFKDLTALVQDGRLERKKLLQEASKQQSLLQAQLAQLEKAKSKYERSFREAEKALDAYKKADQDAHMARAEIDKTKAQWQTRVRLSDDSKTEYASELQNANKVQREYYDVQMPQVFTSLQALEEKRVLKVKEFILSSAAIDRSAQPIINSCIDGMTNAASLVNPQTDSRVVIDRFKTGFYPPSEIPFEDLSNEGNGTANTSNKPVGMADGKGGTVSRTGTVGGSRSKKRSGLRGIFGGQKKEDELEDFSHLPPTQQKKQLIQTIETLRTNLAKEVAARDGMVKMQEVYKNNPSLGEASSLDKGLEENAQKLDRLRQEISKFESYLSEADGRLQGDSGVTPTPSPGMGRRIGESSSNTSSPKITASTPSTAFHQTATSLAGTGAGTQRDSIAALPVAPVSPAHGNHVIEQDSFEDEFAADDGDTCTALYDFAPTTESSLSIKAGEKLIVVDADQGDGWTHVRKLPGVGGDEGFVPTSYIQINDN